MIKDAALLLISPLNVLLLALLFLLLAHRVKKHSVLANSITIIAFIWLLLCSQYSFTNFLNRSLEHRYPQLAYDAPILENIDQIHVLASYLGPHEETPLMHRWSDDGYFRLDAAFHIHKRTGVPIILTGNIQASADASLAIAAAEHLKQLGVEEKYLIAIDQGHNTETEIHALKHLVGTNHTLVVSKATHLPRVQLYYRYYYPDATITTFGTGYQSHNTQDWRLNTPSLHSLTHAESALYEYLALLKIKIFGLQKP